MVPEALTAKRRFGSRAAKEVINTRLSQEVLSAFRATGDGRHPRVDEALRDWLKLHEFKLRRPACKPGQPVRCNCRSDGLGPAAAQALAGPAQSLLGGIGHRLNFRLANERGSP